MKVFIGVYNIANLMNVYAEGFRQLGFEVDCFELSPHPFYTSQSSHIEPHSKHLKDLNSLMYKGGATLPYFDKETLDFFEKSISKYLHYDIYIFMNCISMLPGNIDFPILKRLGKKIISLFSGSEIRHHYSAKEIWETMGNSLPKGIFDNPKSYQGFFYDMFDIIKAPVYENSIEKKLQNISLAEIYSDAILSVPEQSGLQFKPYHAYVHAINPNQIKSKIKSREKPLIAHLPSNPAFKRTAFITEVLQELKSEGLEFDLIIKSRIPHSEVVDIIYEADILIDQMGNFPALLSHEAMGAGCTVLTGNHPLAMPIPLNKYKCPAIHIDPVTLKDTLRAVIKDKNLRKDLSLSGIEYINNYCDPVNAASRLIATLERSLKKDYDYFPMWAHHNNLTLPKQTLTDCIVDLLKINLSQNGQPKSSSRPYSSWDYQYYHLGGWTYLQ